MLGIALLMTSCNEDFKNWNDPQSNSESAKNVGFTVANAAAINYAELEGDSVQLFIPTVTVQDQAVSSFVAKLYNADKSANYEIKADEQGRSSRERD